MIPEDFRTRTGLGAEPMERLTVYADLLIRWQQRINLVGPNTIPDLWRRHMLDSWQLYPLLPPTAHRLVDLGSGAGFPGLVLAILGAPDPHLIESDSRKAAFLREAARATGTEITVHTERIEKVSPLGADIVTARALAPLAKLLPWADRHLAPGGHCLFLKGAGAEDELTEAAKDWMMTCRRTRSITDPSGLILDLEEVRRGRA